MVTMDMDILNLMDIELMEVAMILLIRLMILQMIQLKIIPINLTIHNLTKNLIFLLKMLKWFVELRKTWKWSNWQTVKNTWNTLFTSRTQIVLINSGINLMITMNLNGGLLSKIGGWCNHILHFLAHLWLRQHGGMLGLFLFGQNPNQALKMVHGFNMKSNRFQVCGTCICSGLLKHRFPPCSSGLNSSPGVNQIWAISVWYIWMQVKLAYFSFWMLLKCR